MTANPWRAAAFGLLFICGTAGAGILSADNRTLASSTDFNYTAPVSSSQEGLPIGNGRMGTLVWTEGNTLQMQINRVDVFGSDCTTASFPERNSDYCGGCGFVSLDFGQGGQGGDVFPADQFSQHLSCYDGLMTVAGPQVKVEAQASMDRDVIALRVDDQRAGAGDAVELSMLRPAVVKRGVHTATSAVQASGGRIILTQTFEEGNYYCGSAVVIEVLGRDATTTAGDQGIRLNIGAGSGPFTLLVSSAASMDRKTDIVAQANGQLDAAGAAGFDGMSKADENWWENFWSKSMVHLHSADGLADHLQSAYMYDLYIMACTSQGKYPAKFNGMLWTTAGDRRAWGCEYWGANQSCNYNNSLFASNHLELMRPMFDMYSGMYDSCAQAAVQQWGSEGIYIPETVCFNGLAKLPDDIAAEMRDLYLLRKPWDQMSQRFRDYAYTQQPYSSRWNWMTGGKMVDGRWIPGERGAGPYGPVTHIFSRGAKIAYQYLEQYEYSQDRTWLADRAYPMLKGVAEFYRNYPNLRKEADGKYHIHWVNANEGLWGGQDTDEEIASMMGILPTAIRASEILNVDPDLRAKWQELLANLAPLPRSDNPLATHEYVGPDDNRAGYFREEDTSGPPHWVKALAPVKRGMAASGSDGNTLPIWYFDLCTLETTGFMHDTGVATADRILRPRSSTRPASATRPAGSRGRRRGGVGVLSREPTLAAIMGRAQSVKSLLPGQMLVGEVAILPNGLDLREGAQTQGIERLGNGAEALTDALCQSVPPAPGEPTVIHIFPAWPRDWDADFTLLCRGDFLVSSSMQEGKISFVELVSQSGGDCLIRNPWGDGSVVLYRNGTQDQTIKGNLLTISTANGDDLILVQPGTKPQDYQRRVTDAGTN